MTTPCLLLPLRSLAEAREDRSKKQILDQAFAECVAKMGPCKITMPPLPIVGTNTYAPEPCSNPRQSGRAGHTPSCMCGWPMGAHKTAEIVDFPLTEADLNCAGFFL